jgi:tRNA A37 threonylcarbamoyladenosine biosynthesis protein TsaE
MDLYRLVGADDFSFLSLDKSIQSCTFASNRDSVAVQLCLIVRFGAAICLIEWPECVLHLLPDDRLHIFLTGSADDMLYREARLVIPAGTGSWEERLAAVVPSFEQSTE